MAALMAHRDCPFTDMYPLLCNSEHDMQLLKGNGVTILHSALFSIQINFSEVANYRFDAS